MFTRTKILHLSILTGAIAFYLFSFWRVSESRGGLISKVSPDCYYQIGQSLAEGAGYRLGSHFDECDQAVDMVTDGPTAFKPPGYPLFLAALIKLTNDNPAAPRLVQAASGVTILLLLFGLGSKLASPIVGLIAAVLISLGGGLPTFAYTLMAEVPFTLLTLLLFTMLLYKRSGWYCLASGVLLGIVLLTRNVMLFTVPFLIVWMWRCYPKPLKSVSLHLAAVALVVAPWALRNAVVFGRFIPFSTNGGVAALAVYNSATFDNPGGTADITQMPYWPELTRLSEPERDQRKWALAIEEIRRQPFDKIARLFRAKLINYFFFSNSLEVNQTASSGLSIAYLATLFGLGAVYAVRRSLPDRLGHWLGSPGNQQAFWLLLIMVISQFIIPVAFWADARYRFVVEPFMALTLGIVWTLLLPKVLAIRLSKPAQTS